MRLESIIYNYIITLLDSSDNELLPHSTNQHFSFRSLILTKHIPNVITTESHSMLRVFKYPLLSPISLATTSCSPIYDYLSFFFCMLTLFVILCFLLLIGSLPHSNPHSLSHLQAQLMEYPKLHHLCTS